MVHSPTPYNLGKPNRILYLRHESTGEDIYYQLLIFTKKKQDSLT